MTLEEWLAARPEWYRDAVCRGHPEVRPRASCLVRDESLDDALNLAIRSAIAETKVITIIARAATTSTPPRLLGVLPFKVSDDGTLGLFHDLFRVGQHRDDVLGRSIGFVLDRRRIRQRTALEIRCDHHDPLVARTVLRTTPRRFGHETEGAETSHLAVVVVGSTLVMGAVLAHWHHISLSAARSQHYGDGTGPLLTAERTEAHRVISRGRPPKTGDAHSEAVSGEVRSSAR